MNFITSYVCKIYRGLKAMRESGGVRSVCYGDGMTRAPVVEFDDITRMNEVRLWIKDNFATLKEQFDSTSR